MSERKAINKWYPPDWDPSKAPKKAKKSNANDKVRLMLPFSMKCLQCNEYIAARRKFNARKEVTPDRYMGIKIIKFHIKCPRCNNGIVFKTDPKLAGFMPVEGGVRNYESATETKIKPTETEDEIFARLEREDQENQKFHEQQNKRRHNPFWLAHDKDASKDSMANLEEKLLEQQKEQEMHDHIAYLQAKAQKLHQSGGSDHVASALKESLAEKRKLDSDSEEDAKIKELFAKKVPGHPQVVGGVITVKRRNVDKIKNGMPDQKQLLALQPIPKGLNQAPLQSKLESVSNDTKAPTNETAMPTAKDSVEDILDSSEMSKDSRQADSQPENLSIAHESSNSGSEETGRPAHNSGLSALAGYSSEDDD